MKDLAPLMLRTVNGEAAPYRRLLLSALLAQVMFTCRPMHGWVTTTVDAADFIIFTAQIMNYNLIHHLRVKEIIY